MVGESRTIFDLNQLSTRFFCFLLISAALAFSALFSLAFTANWLSFQKPKVCEAFCLLVFLDIKVLIMKPGLYGARRVAKVHIESTLSKHQRKPKLAIKRGTPRMCLVRSVGPCFLCLLVSTKILTTREQKEIER